MLRPGFTFHKPNQVCKLQKSLYGLKQANRQWYAKLSQALLQCGYVQSKANYSHFVDKQTNSFTGILVYVDVVILAGDDLTEINGIKKFLDASFRMKVLGDLKFFLGLEILNPNLDFLCAIASTLWTF